MARNKVGEDESEYALVVVTRDRVSYGILSVPCRLRVTHSPCMGKILFCLPGISSVSARRQHVPIWLKLPTRT